MTEQDDKQKERSKMLRSMLTEPQNRSPRSESKANQLRAILDDVEELIDAGVKVDAIIKKLAETGLEFTYASFNQTLFRLRKERDEDSKKTVARRSHSQIDLKKNTTVTNATDNVDSGNTENEETLIERDIRLQREKANQDTFHHPIANSKKG